MDAHAIGVGGIIFTTGHLLQPSNEIKKFTLHLCPHSKFRNDKRIIDMSINIRFLGFLLAMIGTAWSIHAQNIKDGHEYVDLGLPSGLLWATCNIGAANENEIGDYFAWGEVEPSIMYNFENYKWGDYDYLTKYNGNPNYGVVDNRSKLQPRDDAAQVIWGGEWRMPTMLEAAELIENCTVWTDEYYMLNVKGPNGNVVKFAFNGGMYDKEVFDFGQIGYYWLSELYSVDSHPQDARVIYVRFDDKLTDTFMYRCYGCNIRPACPGDPSGISIPLTTDKSITYYNINGSKLNGAKKGVNIVKSSDGKVKKLFVK